jgi:hypothetical protein
MEVLNFYDAESLRSEDMQLNEASLALLKCVIIEVGEITI